jgi:hypothetical protein
LVPQRPRVVFHRLPRLAGLGIDGGGRPDGAHHAGRPKKLFEGDYGGYDPEPDGQRFLMVKFPAAQQAASNEVRIVFNWFDELRRRVPVK